jgi:hypothetical protein
MNYKQLETADKVKTCVLSGDATIMLVSKKTGDRFTYRIKKSEQNRMTKCLNVEILFGSDYEFLGKIFNHGNYIHGYASKISFRAVSNKAFDWFWWKISKDGHLPDGLGVWQKLELGELA